MLLKENYEDNSIMYQQQATTSENVPSDMCIRGRFKLAWIANNAKFVHSDNEDSGHNCTGAQANMSLCCTHIRTSEGMFSYIATQMMIWAQLFKASLA